MSSAILAALRAASMCCQSRLSWDLMLSTNGYSRPEKDHINPLQPHELIAHAAALCLAKLYSHAVDLPRESNREIVSGINSGASNRGNRPGMGRGVGRDRPACDHPVERQDVQHKLADRMIVVLASDVRL